MTVQIKKFNWAAVLPLVLVLGLAACGQSSATSSVTTGAPTLTGDTTQTTAAESTTTEPEVSVTEPVSVRVSELDVPKARAALTAAKDLWAQAAISDYTLVHENSETTVNVEVRAGQATNSGEVSNASQFGLDPTVDDMFVRADRAISAAEANPSDIGDAEGACEGLFFDIAFDGTTGAPLVIDRLTPCEDGDPFWSAVVPAS